MFYLKKKKFRTYFGITFFTLGNEVFLFSCLHVPEWLNKIYRSSHHSCSVKKGVPRNFAKFTGKHLHQRLFFRGLQLYLKRVSGAFFFL